MGVAPGCVYERLEDAPRVVRWESCEDILIFSGFSHRNREFARESSWKLAVDRIIPRQLIYASNYFLLSRSKRTAAIFVRTIEE